ncbi:hypothetical protein JRI60_42955 [Archangium violaceum]|uniref:hypothetical protein n=1 Tax=Archangium violaceum TaxID=83451 RepID=UPI00194F7FEA|nr:hypothetical protein [Archangium violaceum]QRN95741.1 hypothetical protein JRI60_42955 [Archangium violaceum]
MPRWNMFLGSVALGLMACGAPVVGNAVLKTDLDSYVAGSEVVLRLRNESLQPLGYNLCYSTLQRHEGAAWETVPIIDNEFCLAIQNRLNPGEESTERRILRESLEEGEYRYLIDVEWDGERQEVTSTSFHVERPSTL